VTEGSDGAGATVYMQRRRGRATGKRSFHTKHTITRDMHSINAWTQLDATRQSCS
jgi:hypothetical protein